MKSRELNRLLINTFPNLVKQYHEEVDWQEGDDTGAHTVYGDVFTPYIVECTKSNNVKELGRIFNYIENLLEKNDTYTNEVIAFSVLESIEYTIKNNKKILNILGQMTKKMLSEL